MTALLNSLQPGLSAKSFIMYFLAYALILKVLLLGKHVLTNYVAVVCMLSNQARNELFGNGELTR